MCLFTNLSRGILERHDSCQNGLARFARSNLCLVHVTPKTEDFSKVPDLDIVFADKSVLVDLFGTDPLIPFLRHDVAGVAVTPWPSAQAPSAPSMWMG
jgi:hypothetical protein